MDTGYIKIRRKIMDWEWYHDLPVFRLFTHMLFTANWKDKRWRGIEIRRGQLVSGRKKLAVSAGLSEQQVRTALEKLKSTNEITIEATRHYTLYTIVKYNDYQDEARSSNQQSSQPATSKEPAKVSETKPEKKEKELSQPYVSEAVMRWNTLAGKYPNLATVKTISKSRTQKLNKRRKEGLTMEKFAEVLENIKDSDFLLGRNKDWKVNFDWVIKNDQNWVKIIEGVYQGRSGDLFGKQPGKKAVQDSRVDAMAANVLEKLGGGSGQAAADSNEFINATQVF